jgi:hypothetical protein
MADKAAEQVAACDAAASSQPQQFVFDLPEGPLLTLHRGEQVGNSAWVEPQAFHPAGKTRNEPVQPQPRALGKLPTAADGVDALSAQGLDLARERANAPQAGDDCVGQAGLPLCRAVDVRVFGPRPKGRGAAETFAQDLILARGTWSGARAPARSDDVVKHGEVDEIARTQAPCTQLALPPLNALDKHENAAEAP